MKELIYVSLAMCAVLTIALTNQINELEEQKLITKQEKIISYNAGFRAGAMEELAILVECDHLTHPRILEDYQIASKTLVSFGELDTTPIYCE